MEKSRLVKLIDLIGGGLAIICAIFYLVIAITNICNLSTDTKFNVFVIIVFILQVALIIGLTLFGIKAMIPFIKNKDRDHSLSLAISSFLTFETIYTLLRMCFYGFNTIFLMIFIFSVIALVVGTLGIFFNFEKTVKLVLNGGSFLLSIVTVIILLCYSSGISLATGIFLLFMVFVALASFILEIAFNETK